MDEKELLEKIKNVEKKLKEKEKKKDPLANIDPEKRKIIIEILKEVYFPVTEGYLKMLMNMSVKELERMLYILRKRNESRHVTGKTEWKKDIEKRRHLEWEI